MNLRKSSPRISERQIEAARELLARRRARQYLLDFTLYTYPDYQPNWHHELLCRYLDAFAYGRIRRLMIFAPPRSGKSELVSRRLPAFMLGLNPDMQIIASSYSADLASRMNRDVQRIIDAPGYDRLFPDTQLYGKNIRTTASGAYLRNSDIFEIVNHRGVYRGAGVGGGIGGMGFDRGIIDDPFKDRKEAGSATVRQSRWDWYTSTFYTRQAPGAGILITHTRWHPNDIAGRVLDLIKESDQAEDWTIINLPAIATGTLHPEDPRQPGEALWADRFPVEFLEKVRAVNAYEFEALYQQNPLMSGTGTFDIAQIEIIDLLPEVARKVRFYDLAVTAKASADYTVGLLMGIDRQENIIIFDVWRVQKDFTAVYAGIIHNAQIDGKEVAIRLEAEKAGIIGLDFMMQDQRLRGYTLDKKAPIGDKWTRAQPFATRVNYGKVKLVKGLWNRAFLDELAMFSPHAAQDDQVDASSGAYDMLSGSPPLRIITIGGSEDYRG